MRIDDRAFPIRPARVMARSRAPEILSRPSKTPSLPEEADGGVFRRGLITVQESTMAASRPDRRQYQKQESHDKYARVRGRDGFPPPADRIDGVD